MTKPPPTQTSVKLKAGSVDSDRRLMVPPAAMHNVELPALLLLEGSKRSRVVRGVRDGGVADNRTIVTASGTLCDRITPGSSSEFDFEAEYSAARWRDTVKDLGWGGSVLIVVAIVVCVGSLAGALATFLNSHLEWGFGFILLAAVIFGAVATAGVSVHKALKIS